MSSNLSNAQSGFYRLTISEQMSYQRLRQVLAARSGNRPPEHPQGGYVTLKILTLQTPIPTSVSNRLKVGPQRASGQRVVCMRPGCSVDIRRATVRLTTQDVREKA